MKDDDILLTSEHPEADVNHIVRGIVRNGLKAVPRKASISLRIDADVLDWFKAQGSGYQTRINAVLRASAMLPANKQLQRTVQTVSRRGARASFHYARAPRCIGQRAAAELRR